MNQPNLKIQSSERDIDPNVLQRRAAAPQTSVWVGASAGSGKTKVLTDRVLRLLLPRDDGQPGSKPHKILCLTFTKAGAGEMSLRLSRTLSAWAIAPEEKLQGDLKDLLGRAPKPLEIKAARRLFAQVIDAPGGLQIMTIHSFCQSVLGRFPLEASAPPHFKPLEEREANILLSLARDAVFKKADAEKSSPLALAIEIIASTINADQFIDLIKNISGERHQLRKLLDKNFGADGLYAKLCATLDILPNQRGYDIFLSGCGDDVFSKELRAIAASLINSKKSEDKKSGEKIAAWLSSSPPERAKQFNAYIGAYFTNDGDMRKSILASDRADILTAKAQRIIKLQDAAKAADSAALTHHLLILAEAILQEFQRIKNERGALDFDDLIGLTLNLLKKEKMAGWVLYKLDQGIDHILIDEAQDTNPEQWEIIELLSEEFMSGHGARDIDRTVFVVGDEKQSIYSFQRAAPEMFRNMHTLFETKIKKSERNWDDVDLNISYRSTESVLRAVDATFETPDMRQGLSLKDIQHHAWRRGQAGLVELWPICEGLKEEDAEPWTPPTRIIEHQTGGARLAQQIAQTIHGWLDNGEILPARDRAIRPEDILILFRSRNAFFHQLARALKSANIPISGDDRMILNEQLAAQDMLAMAQFALSPNDDLTLATILKSPLIGWNEEKLYQAAIGRSGSLWDALQKPDYESETRYLNDLIAQAAVDHPYEFFSRMLQSPCPADSVSGLRAFKQRLGSDATDPLDELLNAALNFERSEVASLQGFLRWQAQESDGIKREMEEPRNETRLMTIHGAKGLQAPIVILPDTIRSKTGGPATNDKRLLWPDKTDLPAPFWTPRSSMECQAFANAKRRIEERQEEESRRLLYVAMTRAEDRLYICGHKGKIAARPDSWHIAVESGLKRIEEHEILENGGVRISNPQIKDPDKADIKSKSEIAAKPAPSWLTAPAPSEPSPPRPLIPSRPSESETSAAPALSPLKNENAYRFRRGILTHKLLQFLPDLSPDRRADAAQKFAERYGADLPADIRQSAAAETLAILNDPEFHQIFGPGSAAEISVTGLIGSNRIISGQIDRLLVTPTDIYIIDYKTNRPPPHHEKDVSPIYIKQMQAYADALKLIYPDRVIHGALLWTDGPRLMPISLS